MLDLKGYQKYVLGVLASLALLVIGLAILAISLWNANQQAVGIKTIF